MSPILPPGLLLAGKPKVDFMHQSSSLQRVPFAFPPQIIVGEAAELSINDGHKLIQRLRVATVPLLQ